MSLGTWPMKAGKTGVMPSSRIRSAIFAPSSARRRRNPVVTEPPTEMLPYQTHGWWAE